MHCYIQYMKDYLSLVKFSHTIFALPFALVGYFLAVNLPGYVFQWKIFVLVLLCMVFARNSAMAFNRYLDRDIDGEESKDRFKKNSCRNPECSGSVSIRDCQCDSLYYYYVFYQFDLLLS